MRLVISLELFRRAVILAAKELSVSWRALETDPTPASSISSRFLTRASSVKARIRKLPPPALLLVDNDELFIRSASFHIDISSGLATAVIVFLLRSISGGSGVVRETFLDLYNYVISLNLARSPPFLFQRSPDLDHSNRNEKISLVARLLKVAHRGPDPDIYQRTTVGSEYFF